MSMEEPMDDASDSSQTNERGRGAGSESDEAAGRPRAGEHRTTAAAESARLRADEQIQAEHPDLIGGRGRATGEPPLRATDEDADPGEPTT
jgi:hypothetical protein